MDAPAKLYFLRGEGLEYLGFRFYGLGLRVAGLGLRVQGLEQNTLHHWYDPQGHTACQFVVGWYFEPSTPEKARTKIPSAIPETVEPKKPKAQSLKR